MKKSYFDIKMKVASESDLFSALDPEQMVVSDDVLSFLEERYEEKRIADCPRLTILSSTPLNRQQVQEAFSRRIDKALEKNLRERRVNRIKQLRLFIIGVFFIALAILLSSHIQPVIAEILSIIGSFAVWEATSIWLIESPATRINNRKLERLKNMEIIFGTETDL